jgi:hypothetical protein
MTFPSNVLPQGGGKSKFLLAISDYSYTLKKEAMRSSEKLVNVGSLHGVTSQKIVLFVVSPVRISELKHWNWY